MTGGGAERVGVVLANGFARNGHDVSIVTDIYQEATYDVDNNIKILPLNPNTKYSFSKWIGALFLMWNHVRREKPDVVIGIMQLCSLVSRLACFGTGIPVIMTEHDAYERIPSEHLTKMEVFSKYYLDKIYHCITILTEADRKVIDNHLKNVVVMPNPLPFESVKEVPIKGQYIFAVGRVSDWHCKGFDLLIEAWGKIASKYPEWSLKIAGDGSKEDFIFLKDKAIENSVVEKTEFLGYRTDMLHLYQPAAIYVLSSRSEGFSMSLIEAMSQGCACVATDFKGRMKEIITTDSEGILCNPEDADALALGMEKLIVDDDYRVKLQQNAINRSEYFSLDHIIGMWENLLSKIVQNN